MKFKYGSLKSWFYHHLAEAFKESPVGRLYATQSFDDRQPHPYDYATHLKVYSVNVYAFAAMRAIARDVSSTPFMVQQQVRQDGELIWRTQESGELFDIFNRPNPTEAWDMLSERWLLSLLAAGNGYLTFEDEKELWHVKADWIKITTKAGQLDGYIATNRGLTERFKLEEIIHIKLSDPSGEYYGIPPSQVIKKSIMMKISQSDYIRNYFKKGAIPGMVLSTDKSLTSDQMAILRKEFDKAYTGDQNQFGVMVFSDGMRSERTPPDIKNLIPNELDLMVMREVLAAYGVPPVKIGVLDGATYANAFEQDKTYQHGTVDPIRRLVENAINLQLVRIHFPGWRVRYDRTEVAGLNEDMDKKSVRIDRDWRNGLIRRNEARIILGYEKIKEDESGEEFFPIGGAGSALVGLNEPVENRALPGRTKLIETPRYHMWKGFDVRANKKAGILQKHINLFFDGQLERLLDSIAVITGNGKLMLRLGFLTLKDHEIPEGFIRDLFNIETENAILIRDLSAVLETLAEQAGQEALDQFRIDFQFNVQDPTFEAVMEQLTKKITRINDATWRGVKRVVGQSFDSGESLATLSDRLSSQFKNFSKARSATIARTETGRLSNTAAHNAYGQAGVEKKEWLSVQDGNVRDMHMSPADGEIVGLKDFFIMTGEALMYPNDPNGSAANTINCRCISVPIVEAS